MVIGIDASRAFAKERTGIEEYSYQVIKHLKNKLKDHQVCLYVKKKQQPDFTLPKNWRIKHINLPYLWTQFGLSLEMLFHPADVLFVPAHTVPFIHPENTIVTVHGLEYEKLPQAYSFWERLYMRWSVRHSCRVAKEIVSVSENTEKDLGELYKIPPEKIRVVYEGCSNCHFERSGGSNFNKDNVESFSVQDGSGKYLFFIGRLEQRKNIIGIIRAFEILKERYKLPHKLFLAGKFGFGAEKISQEIRNINFSGEIILTGFVSEEKKWQLLKNAAVFLFPTFYEGFGLPILEAQSVGTPVVAGDNSSIKEITRLPLIPPAGEADYCSALLVDPHNAEAIADATHSLISDKKLRDDIIEKGYKNVQRFSWENCAQEIAKILTK